MRRIALGLTLIVIFMIPWEGVLRLAGAGQSGTTVVRLVGLGVFVFWIATVIITGRFRKPGIFHIAVFLFVLWNALSVFWSAIPSRTVTQLITWVQLLGLTILIWDLFTTRNAILAGLQAYILGAYVAVGIAAINFMAGRAFYTHYQRFSPDETNPDGYGFILALGIPVAWYLASSISELQRGNWLKWINYGYIPVAFLGIALSGTRTALIAAVPGMIYGLLTLFQIRLSTRIIATILLGGAILFAIPFVQTLPSFQRFGTIGAEISQGDLNNRTTNWLEGLASFEEHPLLGVGSNMYRSVNIRGRVAHNSFISVMVQLGLIGFILFVGILTIAALYAWVQSKWDRRFWITMLLVWTIGASTLTWEHRKTTWLFTSLLVTSAAAYQFRKEDATIELAGDPEPSLLLDSKGST